MRSPSSCCSSSSSSSSSFAGPETPHLNQAENQKPKAKRIRKNQSNPTEKCQNGTNPNTGGGIDGLEDLKLISGIRAHGTTFRTKKDAKGPTIVRRLLLIPTILLPLSIGAPDNPEFPETYTKELEEMQKASREEYLASLRRRSSGFSRGVSKYRGVARHHHNGRWEARIGRVFGNKYLYLGTYNTQEEAAAAYDMAAIEYRGANAVTNFDINNYIDKFKKESEETPPKCFDAGCWKTKKSSTKCTNYNHNSSNNKKNKLSQPNLSIHIYCIA
ncbi:Integrase-type DNA-binding superfamily protein [Prunus dulcis]|uniref:Integrase-type DNA-binding superfamily protein n=1 Tax=Prunus dulcis TaxID=3755 RepID=A0A4Y1QY26_PRUDU|nr:Integrase-type DNA-binding superfamily protein [Prunus dulcis]